MDTEGAMKIGEQSWVRLSLVAMLLTVPVVLWTKFGTIDTALGVTATKIEHLVVGQNETNATLKHIADRMDGEREKLGNHEGRITAIERWREQIDRRLDTGK